MAKLKMAVLCRLRLLGVWLIDSSALGCLFPIETVRIGLIRVACTSVLSNLLLHRANLRRKKKSSACCVF